MGLLDGKSPLENTGSTAEISMITESPVLLIVNCASMARSAALSLKAFKRLSERSKYRWGDCEPVGSDRTL